MPNKPLLPEQITIIITDELIKIEQGKVKGSKLAYHAAGLQIYKIGMSDYHHIDCLSNLAMQACQMRHIPITSLRHVFTNSRTPKAVETKTRSMFDKE